MRPSTWTKRFPTKEGWVRAQLTMKTSDIVNAEEIKKLISGGSPETHEFGELTQHGKRVVCIFRRRTTVVKMEAAAVESGVGS